MALAAGAFVSMQAAANSSLARHLGHPLWAAAVSLLVSTAVVAAAVAAMKIPLPAARLVSTGPWWLWIGGIAGVVYLGSAVTLPSKIGTGAFILWVIAGQMLASIVIDHFGLFGMATRPVSIARVAGALTVVAGLVISQLGPSAQPQA